MNQKNFTDHDLLIQLHEKVDVLLEGFKDHEPRLRKLESQGNIIRGGLAIIVFVAGLIEPFLLWRKK